MPFVYYGIITFDYYFTKYCIMSERASGLTDFAPWEKYSCYLYVTVVVAILSFFIEAILIQPDSFMSSKDGFASMYYQIVVLLLPPALIGVSAGNSMTYDECLSKKANARNNRHDNHL